MNKLALLILILLLANNCSIKKKQGFWVKGKNSIEEVKNTKIILSKKTNKEKEFNTGLEINITNEKLSKNSINNQNNTGELAYDGKLEKIGKYNFSKFDNFEHIDVRPIFYNNKIIFADNKGTIILYDQNQKIIWKKNFYNKSEKKLNPRLNFANHNNILIVTDNVAKYYAINIETGNIIWSKNNIVPFNSEIKIKGNYFYVVDYKNILRSLSIVDGSEIWSLKTEESLTKSNTKISVVIKNENVYFNNSIGDITAVNLKTGQLVWQLPTQSNDISKNAFQLSNSQLVIAKESILFSNNRKELYSIDTTTGLINWKNEISSNLKPIVIGKLLLTVSDKGYLYIINRKKGNIVRVNDLYKFYKTKKRKYIFPTGFFIAQKKIYLSNNNGELIIADLNTGNVININKISGDKILRPHVNNNNLFIIKNGSIVKFN